MDTKLSEFCLKSLMKYLLAELLEWLEIITWDIYDSTHNLKRKLSCSVPWNWWNLMELGGVFERPFCRKNVSKPKPFLINTTQNGLEHKKADGNKDFQCNLSRNIWFGQFNHPIPCHLENFWQTLAYCAVNVPHQAKILVCRDSDQKYQPSRDNTVAVAINLQKVAIGTTRIWHGVEI